MRIRQFLKSHVKELDLVWSYIIEFENEANPFEERKDAIGKWRLRAGLDIEETQEILAKSSVLRAVGFSSKDALHVACAISAGCT